MSIHILDDETDASVSFHGSYVDELRQYLRLTYDADLTETELSIAIDDGKRKEAETTE